MLTSLVPFGSHVGGDLGPFGGLLGLLGSLGAPLDLLGGVLGLSCSSLGAPLVPPGPLLRPLRPHLGASWLSREPREDSGVHFLWICLWISDVL